MRAGVRIRLCVCSHCAMILHKSPRKSRPRIMILGNAGMQTMICYVIFLDQMGQLRKVYYVGGIQGGICYDLASLAILLNWGLDFARVIALTYTSARSTPLAMILSPSSAIHWLAGLNFFTDCVDLPVIVLRSPNRYN